MTDPTTSTQHSGRAASNPAAHLLEGSALGLAWKLRIHGQLVVVAAEGELDASNAQALREALGPFAAGGYHLVVDMTGLGFCGCAGLNLFVQIQRHACDAGGSLCLASPALAVRRTIAGLRLESSLNIAVDVPAAITVFGRDAISERR